MKILIAGAGKMGLAYYQVLSAMGHEVTVFGRGTVSAVNFFEKTGQTVVTGNWQNLKQPLENFDAAIVAVSIDSLFSCTMELINGGMRKILLEKPGTAQPSDLALLQEACKSRGTFLRLAYNRRFYEVVTTAAAKIESEGGAERFHFEFGENITKLEAARTLPTLSRTVYNHSCHLIDLAFQLGGVPKEISCAHEGSFPWHPSAAMKGSGRTAGGSAFSYQTDWRKIGRWKLQVWTREHQFLFAPLEQPQWASLETDEYVPLPVALQKDHQFKPGLWSMISAFLHQENDPGLGTLDGQVTLARFCYHIADYPIAELG